MWDAEFVESFVESFLSFFLRTYAILDEDHGFHSDITNETIDTGWNVNVPEDITHS